MLKQQANSTLPFPMTQLQVPNRQPIALISVHGDPAAEIGSEEAGGQNVYVRQLGEALAARGWQVDLFTRKADPDAPEIVEHSPHCRTIRLQAGPETFIPRDRLFEYLPQFITAWEKYQSKSRYPLIHTNYWLSGWVGLQLQKRYNLQWLHTYHSLGAVKYQATNQLPLIASKRLHIEREILENCDRVIATSPQEEEHLREFVSSQGEIQIIPCGTDTKRFSPQPKAEAKAKLGFSSDEQIVLYVGRFDPRKGIETLVRAFAHSVAEKRKLVIVGGSDEKRGDNSERDRIVELGEELGLRDRVVFAGRIGHQLLPTYYASADVTVVPSHYEPFGLVAIEAMACGTPVIASDVGGLRFTVIHNQTGLLVSPQDEMGFAHAMEHILNHPHYAQKLQRRAIKRVQNYFSWSGVAGQLSGVYRNLLAASLMSESVLPQVQTPQATELAFAS
ncbi:glycosyl transferase group 1 [Halothece sp. PCC 7418]|uniref:glycosyltransferase family 4 protein n=1 Tax=Halothece sp. (strain PCC 7418) TaxID=65093 RepID=UPI0002A084B7|nr:glycosyltransferase family 1 protein [Halothece sp. PCC 7418]AFZ45113.1 glycosyl transferase group 1 [Halothece sp. PCC 7418]